MLVVAPQPFFSCRGTPFSVYYRTLVAAELGLNCDLLTYGQGTDVELPGCRIYRIPAMRWLGEVKVGPSPLKMLLDTLMVFWTIAL
ncbi:MAG: glycosyltransferase, partial [Woeseiaceae bacterium]